MRYLCNASVCNYQAHFRSNIEILRFAYSLDKISKKIGLNLLEDSNMVIDNFVQPLIDVKCNDSLTYKLKITHLSSSQAI